MKIHHGVAEEIHHGVPEKVVMGVCPRQSWLIQLAEFTADTVCRTLSLISNAPAYVTGSVRSIPESWDRLSLWRGVCEGHYGT